jgi:thioredoxin reductase
MTYDLIIIGAGPAGFTSAIYALRRELKILMIAKANGGQAAIAHAVENWPGEQSIGGFELMQKMEQHAKSLGLEINSNEVVEIVKNDADFTVKTASDEFTAGAVILAFGLTPRDLGVPGEKELTGKGVSYCATCDGPFFRNKIVAVIGGGNSAIEAGEYLSKLAKRVYLINNSAKFNIEEGVLQNIRAIENIDILCGKSVKEIIGVSKVEKLSLTDFQSETAPGFDASETLCKLSDPNVLVKNGETQELAVDGVFIEIGFSPKTGWLKDTVELNERKEIVTDKAGKTSVEGIFAAGDCTDVGFKQIVISAGEGSKAALSAYKYLAGKRGLTAIPDWGEKK